MTLRLFFFNDTATTEIYTLSLHDALPISAVNTMPLTKGMLNSKEKPIAPPKNSARSVAITANSLADRKSTRLNSSHLVISYAVFCLKKKKKMQQARI